MITTVKISEARICIPCAQLVTDQLTCPSCDQPTQPHPEKDIDYTYCCQCGEGPLPASRIHVITHEEDPYCQTEDGMLITACNTCRREESDD